LIKLKLKIAYVSFVIVLTTIYSSAQSKTENQFGTYNFGLEHLDPAEQIEFIEGLGYKSFFFRVKVPKDLELLKGYSAALLDSNKDFKIESVYYPCKTTDKPAQADYWKNVIDELSGKSISFSLIMRGFDEPGLEKKLIEIVDYAEQANLEVVLYPHFDTSI
tara:strand:+ start:1315 stop:1800 length:486 start_codon:yes stop_codon:yes gene_type:complete